MVVGAQPPGEMRDVEHDVAVLQRLDEDQALLEVEHESDQRPVLRYVGEDVEEGRGLFLVKAVATQWGWRLSNRGGKTVWASLVLPVGPAA
ncbi:hypothetical protein [Streptomyces sp. 7N604]|uniref:hypothetical protein n=1 Tax=Streptomyces sp. 7N604 TaxID=3457415 RepID=UPI003FCF42D7